METYTDRNGEKDREPERFTKTENTQRERQRYTYKSKYRP